MFFPNKTQKLVNKRVQRFLYMTGNIEIGVQNQAATDLSR